MSVAYPADLLPPSEKDEGVVELHTCAQPGRVSGRPVLNEFGAGFALKQDVTIDGTISPKIVWVSRNR